MSALVGRWTERVNPDTMMHGARAFAILLTLLNYSLRSVSWKCPLGQPVLIEPVYSSIRIRTADELR